MKFDGKKERIEEKLDKLLLLADKFCSENNDIVSCMDTTQIFKWENSYWRTKKDHEIEIFLLTYDEAFKYLNRNKLKEVFYRIGCLKHRPINDFNNHDLLDLENGVLNLQTLEFGDHKKEYLSTTRIPYKYDAAAECPLWLKFLDEVLESNEKAINTLQEYIGYCLGRDNSFHKALILLGEGRNGKGTTFHVISKLVGNENFSALKLQEMNDKETVSRLVGKLVNIDADTAIDASGYEANFRRITAGDIITARFLYKEPFEFVPHVKLIIGANDLPRISDKTHGFYDRLIIIPFEVSFYGREDRNLKMKLEQEISGILNWAIAGRHRLYKQGQFTTNETMLEAVKELKTENNPTELYVEDNVCFRDNIFTSKTDIYNDYVRWCKDNGHHPLSKIKFGKEFFRCCRTKTKKHARSDDHNQMHIWPNVYLRNKYPEGPPVHMAGTSTEKVEAKGDWGWE